MGTSWDFLVCLHLFPPQKNLQCSVVERDELLITVSPLSCLISCRIWQLTHLSPLFHAIQAQWGFLNKLIARWQHEKEMCIVYISVSFFYNSSFEDKYKTEFSNDISLHLGVCLIICYYVYSALSWCNRNKSANQTKGFWGTYIYIL